MLLPHDVFNDIIIHTDIQSFIQLYHTDQTIKQLCINYLFDKLLAFNNHPHFNPNVTSPLLNDFLNDLVGNDVDMLKRLQLSFGACLLDKKFNKKIIVLCGSSNGKWTFTRLLSLLLGHRFKYGSLRDTGLYKDAYIVNITEETSYENNVLPILNQLDQENTFNIIYSHNKLILQDDNIFNKKLNIFNFKTVYVNNPVNINEKLRKPTMLSQLDNPSTLSALLNFLLQGCREVLDH